MTGHRRTAAWATALTTAVASAVMLSGCSTPTAKGPDPVQTAKQVTKVTSRSPDAGGTLLEGPVLDGRGNLWIVDVRAPAGEPKLLRLNLRTHATKELLTDRDGVYTSVQRSPEDGRLYLTDFLGGRVISVTTDGGDRRTVFEGPVEGELMSPDDIAFDRAGNIFVSDSHGISDPHWDSSGRIVRIDAKTHAATVVADKLPAPNGISFDTAGTGLWVSEYNANRIDHIGLDDTGKMTSAYAAAYLDGGVARVDSNAVDAAGNIYQAWEGKPQIDVLSPTGERLQQIRLPKNAPDLQLATNIAIEPDGRTGYMTVSGPAGGYVYRFTALGDGIRQSNGG